MRSLRYLNLMLTVIAVLLTLQLWTAWATGPALLSSTAEAATGKHTRSYKAAKRSGIVNAGEQRADTNKRLDQLLKKTDTLIGLFRSGKARVRIEGASSKDTKRTR
jgi:hypothetical protein